VEELVAELDRLTRSELWPRRWMTVPEFSAGLDGLGFWSHPEFAGYSGGDRLNFIASAFQTSMLPGVEMPIWNCIGSQYKHDSLTTLEDFKQLVQWECELAAHHC